MPTHLPPTPELLAAARRRLAWVESQMPILAASRSRTEAPLAGQRIAARGHITFQSAVQMRVLSALGAELAFCASNAVTADPSVVGLMAAEGIAIVGRDGVKVDAGRTALEELLRFFPDGPTLLLDEGADLITLIHAEHRELADRLLGAVEKTGSGVQRLREMSGQGKLLFPVVLVDLAVLKSEMDNGQATGQSVLEAILHASQILLAGKTFVVAGFGAVGRGIAQRARGMGCRVVVTEARPTVALKALMEGYEVMPMAQAAGVADVLCTATGRAGAITAAHLERLKPGVVLANAGHFNHEIDLAALAQSAVQRDPVRPGNERLILADGRTVFLLGGGEVVNLTVGEGNVSEAMDVVFACQVAALEHLLSRDGPRDPGLHLLPEEVEERIARRKLAALDIRTEA